MATLEEIRAARARSQGVNPVLAEIRAARARSKGVRTPDGRATAPGTTEEQASRIPEGMIWNPETNSYIDAAAQAERMGSARGAAATYIAGTPFVGEYADEAIGAIDAALTGRPQGFGQEVARQSREQFHDENPATAIGLEIAGGVVGSMPLAAAATPAIMSAPGVLGKAAAATAGGGAAGVVEGAVAGYGRGRTQEDRKDNAMAGAVLGGGFGAAAGALAPALGMGASALYRRIRRIDVKTIADEFGIDRKAAALLKRMIAADDLDGAQRVLADIGDDAMIADIGPAAGQALDTVTQTGGDALRIGKEAVEGRAAKVGGQVSEKLDEVLGPPDGVKGAARDISRRTARTRSIAYDRAYASPIDYASDAGRKIEEVLERVPTETMRRALKEANEAMIEAGQKNQQILAEIAEDGSVSFREMPSVRQLDELKKALGQIAQNETDEFGRKTSGVGIRAGRLAGDLRAALGDAVPAYNRAVRLGGDKITEDNALRMGAGLLSKSTRLEDVKAFAGDLSTEARTALRRGLREDIENTLSNVRRTITDPNSDAREAMALVKAMSSRANRAKLVAALGPRDARAITAELDRAGSSLALRSMIAQNSKTAIRQAGREGLDEAAQPGMLGALGRGELMESGQKLIQALTGATDEATLARRADVAAQIASALTDKRGRDAQRALAIVKRAMDGQPLKDGQAELVAKVVANSGALAGYQSGMQTLGQ